MKATNNGSLRSIQDCYIVVPGAGTITFNNLPDVSDSKTAVYNTEAIIGRSTPLYTYSHSGDRTISMQLHFFIVDPEDATNNLKYLRWIQSAVYPREGTNGSPFTPPVICQIKCGQLLADQELCCVLQSYSVKFPTEVVWNDSNFCPFKFDVETSWVVVYTSDDLPFQSRIVQSGR